MEQASSPVYSAQRGPDARLARIVDRHRTRAHLKPPASHTCEAFAALEARIGAAPAPIVLDSGCGTGESTARLAGSHPDCWVVGVDRSAHRLARGATRARPANALVVRAELADFWHLASNAGWRLAAHYLLYPNPYPKPRHLQRRWHASGAFPWLLRLGGALRLRTNWRVYAEEFARALSLWGLPATVEALAVDGASLSPFEHKYRASGHALFEVRADLGALAGRAGARQAGARGAP